MTADRLLSSVAVEPAAPDLRVPGLRAVVALLDRPVGQRWARWLRSCLVPLPPAIDRRIVRIADSWSSVGDSGGDEAFGVDSVHRALNARRNDHRAVIGRFEVVASSFDDSRVLSILHDDGRGQSPGTRWALREARGSTLVLPKTDGQSGAGVSRRALLVARDEAEVALLRSWCRLLRADVEVELKAVLAPATDAPAVAVRELSGLRVALHEAAAELESEGRRVRGEPIVVDDPPEDGFDLVVRVARRGPLRRWLPGSDARACRRHPCPRLLIAPNATRLVRSGR